MKDGILYNLPNIKRYVLDDGIIEQGTLARHFTHILRRNETRCDEVMPYLRDVGQMFGIEMHCMPFTIYLPLTLPVGQYPNDLRVVWGCIEAVKCPIVHGFQIVELVDGLHTEVDPNLKHPNPFFHICG